MTRINPTDIVGKRFGRLVIASVVEGAGRTYVRSRCDCGNETLQRFSHIKQGRTISCGCVMRAQLTTHGMSHTVEYRTWKHMIERCHRPSNAGYSYYGGRGIRVCRRWHTFENFFADMGQRPPNTELDRIDNHKGYTASNCKWSTRKEQMRNTRSNHLISYNGETHPLVVWAEFVGISEGGLLRRLALNWPLKKALFTPVKTKCLGV